MTLPPLELCYDRPVREQLSKLLETELCFLDPGEVHNVPVRFVAVCTPAAQCVVGALFALLIASTPPSILNFQENSRICQWEGNQFTRVFSGCKIQGFSPGLCTLPTRVAPKAMVI